jgi:pyrroline-5-carboxylate reductase
MDSDTKGYVPMLAGKRIFFLGAGSISEAIIKGLLETEAVAPRQITICNRQNAARLDHLHETYRVAVSAERRDDIAAADVVLIAVKPFDVAVALAPVSDAISAHQLVISVAAGVTTATIERRLAADVPVIRAMPNTSSFVQASATALCRGHHAGDSHLLLARHLFAAIGTVTTVEETAMDAVTGLAGTGPAYIYYVVEALLEGGIAAGLDEQICREMLLQTVAGAAKMLHATGHPPAELRRQVTSPNGTTMAGIGVLDEGAVKDTFRRAVLRATERAGELGQLTLND